jgi:hypothetical protein
MTEKRLGFSPELYRRYWKWRMRLIYGISGFFDLVLLWQMVFKVPDAVLTQEVPSSVWNAPLLLLILINTGIAGYAAYRYSKYQKLREESCVTLTDSVVVHYIQEPFLSEETARMAREGYRSPDRTVEFYAAYLKYRVTSITKLGYNRFGAIVLEGSVERTYHDEYLQSEDGNGYSVMTVRKHKIPAYYEDMVAVYDALDKLRAS